MDVTGAGLHNIETKWLYDFLTLEKCRNFSQAAIIRNVSQPAFSRRIRATEHAVGVELFNRQVSPLQLSEQGKIFHSQVRHLLQQLESNLTELRGGSDYTLRKIKIAAAHSLSLGLLPTIVKQMPTQFTYAVEAIDVDRAVDMLREGQSDFIFLITMKTCNKRRLITSACLSRDCFRFAPTMAGASRAIRLSSRTFPCLITVRTPIWAG